MNGLIIDLNFFFFLSFFSTEWCIIIHRCHNSFISISRFSLYTYIYIYIAALKLVRLCHNYFLNDADGDVLVTVRGCVPSRKIDGYCQQTEHFPGSSIKCSFCDDYACNSQNSSRVSNNLISIILTLIPSIIPIIYLF